MRHELAKTKNVKRFMGALHDLQTRGLGIEGMGILWGQPGEGKSTVIAYATNTLNGVFMRANACWTVTAMLGTLVRELGGQAKSFRAPMVEWAASELSERPRPVFIDEADYLLRDASMIDSMRDLYDMSGCPVVFIGMEDLGRKLAGVERYSRFSRRITQWIEFCGLDLEDARMVADTVCEVKVADDLIAHLHEETRGNIGRMVTGLSLIERMGKTNSLPVVTAKDWGKRTLYFGQPQFSRRAR